MNGRMLCRSLGLLMLAAAKAPSADAQKWHATMDGALESGWRAAVEAIRATGANAVVSE